MDFGTFVVLLILLAGFGISIAAMAADRNKEQRDALKGHVQSEFSCDELIILKTAVGPRAPI